MRVPRTLKHLFQVGQAALCAAACCAFWGRATKLPPATEEYLWGLETVSCLGSWSGLLG
jgi:hypothetical protein